MLELPLSDETETGCDSQSDGLETRRVNPSRSARVIGVPYSGHHTGETLGRYVLLRPLGAGGMSVVWLAFDPELDRHVALKLMHEGALPIATGAQRLLREAQALARLSHVNVVHVYDVGIVGGEVYLAMELVDGVTLREWLAAARRPWTEILATAVRAGAGLAAAHDAGLVHLDFKPTNVVVGHDGSVRVVDFGLARPPSETSRRESGELTESRPGHRLLGERLTEEGSVLGTPGYIPPEVMRGAPADGRADQFSFCVTVWEALFGERPFEPDARGGEPLAAAGLRPTGRPHSRTTRSGRFRPSPLGSAVPRVIRQALIRGLSTDPADRFPSMALLLHALRRPDKTRVVASALIGAFGVAGAVAAFAPWPQPVHQCEAAAQALLEAWNPERAAALEKQFVDTSAPFAADAWAAVSQVIDVHTQAWSQQARDACEARMVHAEQSAATYELRKGCLLELRDHLEELLTVFASADASIVEHALTAAVGVGDPSSCADIESLHAKASLPTDPVLLARVEELRLATVRTRVMLDSGMANSAWVAMVPLLATARTIDHPPTVAALVRLAAAIRTALGDPNRSVELLDQALIMSEAAGLDEMRFLIYGDLTYVVGHQLRDRERGESFGGTAMSLHARIGGTPDQLRRLLVTRGILASGGGNYQLAMQLYADVLAISEADDPVLPTVLLDMGGVQYESGRFDSALDYYQQAYELQVVRYGPSHPETAIILENLGNAYQAIGDFDTALSFHQRSLAILEGAGVTTGIIFAHQLNNAGVVLSGLQRYSEAASYYQRARGVLGREHASHPLASILLTNLGESLLAQGQPDEALGLYRTALGDLERSLGVSHQYVGVTLTGMGLCELELGAHVLAREHLARALKIHAKGGDPVQRAETELGLARAIVLSGAVTELARARDYARSARATFVTAGDRGVGQVQRVDALIAHLNR